MLVVLYADKNTVQEVYHKERKFSSTQMEAGINV